MDDAGIIALYFARDERAIEETAAKYGRLCFGIAKNILGSGEDSEECVNDTYLSVWNAIPPARPDNFPAYIGKIARNLSLKRLDFNTAEKRSPGVVVPLSELSEIVSPMALEPDGAELARAISDFLRGEKEPARSVFIRRYWFFDSVGDIAARYSFSESKVKSMLYHTRRRLKVYLGKAGFEL